MRSLAAVALLACCACGRPPVIWSGLRIDFAADEDDAETLCEGTLPWADANADVLAQMLERPDDERVTFYWLPTGSAGYPCDEPHRGCASPGQAFSRSAIQDHEVVHAFAGRMGQADPFLEEGLAEFLGGSQWRQAAGDPRDYIGRGRASGDPFFYPTAGRFVARLAEMSSLHAVLDVYRNSDETDDPARFEALVSRHTGVTVADVADSFLAEPPCSSLAYRERSLACSYPPVHFERGGAPTLIEASLDCTDPDTVGRAGSLQWHGTLELSEWQPVTATVNDGTTAQLLPCEPGCAAGDAVFVRAAEELWLEAGRYHVVLLRTEPGVGRLALE